MVSSTKLLTFLLIATAIGCSAFVAPLSNVKAQSTKPPPSFALLAGVRERSIDEEANNSPWKGFLAPILPLLFSTIVALPVHAMIDASSVYNHDYADPLHPLCDRKIEVSRDGKTFHYSGTAVGPKDDPILRACSSQEIKEFGLRNGAFDGSIVVEGNKISAGDGIHEGVWEPKNTAKTNLGYENVDGIRWNDGNKWVVKSQSQAILVNGKWTVQSKSAATAAGEFIFLAYIGFSALAGIKGLYDGIQRKRQTSG